MCLKCRNSFQLRDRDPRSTTITHKANNVAGRKEEGDGGGTPHCEQRIVCSYDMVFHAPLDSPSENVAVLCCGLLRIASREQTHAMNDE